MTFSGVAGMGAGPSCDALDEKRMIWKTMDGSDPCYEYVTRKRLAAEMMAEIMEGFLSDEMDRETFLKLKKRIEEDIEEH